LGNTTNERLDTVINDIITNSMDKDDIIMSEEIDASLQELREFMFREVYLNPVAKAEEVKAKRMLEFLFEHYMNNFDILPEKFTRMHYEGEDPKDRVVCDYIAGMTDVFAINLFNEYFMPKSWHVF
jgi:dGTPase